MEAQKTISTTFRQYLLVLQHNIQWTVHMTMATFGPKWRTHLGRSWLPISSDEP